MIVPKAALLFVVLLFTLTPALANPHPHPHPHPLLVVRQGSFPGSVPSSCDANCNNLDNLSGTCANGVTDQDVLNCLCSSSTVNAFNKCASCIVRSNPGSQVVSEVQSAQSGFYSACAEAGDPIGSPPSLNSGTTVGFSVMGCMMGVVMGAVVVMF